MKNFGTTGKCFLYLIDVHYDAVYTFVNTKINPGKYAKVVTHLSSRNSKSGTAQSHARQRQIPDIRIIDGNNPFTRGYVLIKGMLRLARETAES